MTDLLAPPLLALAGSPLLLGIVNKTKAAFAGRAGAPLLQPYYDLAKLLGKGAVYSRTTTWVFRAGPAVQLACALTAAAVVPLGGRPAALSFSGDFLLLAGLLAAMRFAGAAAALDAGSSFEAMGASRELQFAALAEPALLLSLAALARACGRLSLAGMFAAHPGGPAPVLAAAALFAVFLAENGRVPVDDPATHLELTMVHEVMVLDHCGPDLAFINYAAALRLWVLGALLLGPLLPRGTGPGTAAAALAGLAVLTGLVESATARLRLVRVPQLLVGAGTLAALAVMLARGGR